MERRKWRAALDLTPADIAFANACPMLFQGLEQQRGAAMTAEVDFTSQAFFRDPAAGVERLRALGPVVATRFPIVGKVWITTTYEATARVLKDGETFTLRKEGGGLAGLRWWMPSFVAARSWIWSRAFALSPTISPANCSPTEARPISSRDMRERCRSRSSASYSVCRSPTGQSSSPGPTRSRGLPGLPISCA